MAALAIGVQKPDWYSSPPSGHWIAVRSNSPGMLRSREFNINYFAAGEVTLRYRDLQEWFSKTLPADEWRFAKLHSYGAQIDQFIWDFT